MYKIRIKYTKAKQAIFISQKDELKTIEKAITRIGGDIYYEADDFTNIDSAMPLFDNMESTSEICDILIREPMEASYITQALNKILPVGIVVMSVECLQDDTPNISDVVYAATYEIIPEFSNTKNMTRREEEDLNLWYKDSLKKYLNEESLLVLIKTQDRNERIDIKPYILDYEILINNNLRITFESNKVYIFNPSYMIYGLTESLKKEIKYNIKRTNILYKK